MSFAYAMKLKQAKDAAMRIVEASSRAEQLIMLQYLPVVLGRREGRDFGPGRNLDEEIKRELER